MSWYASYHIGPKHARVASCPRLGLRTAKHHGRRPAAQRSFDASHPVFDLHVRLGDIQAARRYVERLIARGCW